MSDYKPYVSIIMSCYNEEIIWLKKSIESILNQTYKNFEFIIICDNPKNKEIIELLESYRKTDSRLRIIINEYNIGLVKSLNKGLSLSKGELIARMDADDISVSERIEKQVTFMVNNPNIALTMTGVIDIDETESVIKKRSNSHLKSNNIKKALYYGTISVHPTWMFRREILNKVECYSELDYVEDYDFLCRVILNGYNIYCIPEYLLFYRKRQNSITRGKRSIQEINTQIVSKNYRICKKDIERYNPKLDINFLSQHVIEQYNITDLEFKKYKNDFLYNKKVLNIFRILGIFIKCSIKRKQILNYILLKIIVFM